MISPATDVAAIAGSPAVTSSRAPDRLVYVDEPVKFMAKNETALPVRSA
jgi:hypothetical protein